MTLLGKVLPLQVTGSEGKDLIPPPPPPIVLPADKEEIARVYKELMG